MLGYIYFSLYCRETECVHPVVCRRGLQSLMDILQGLQPEDLRSVPGRLRGSASGVIGHGAEGAAGSIPASVTLLVFF